MRVRKVGAGALSWASGSLSGGEVGEVPTEVALRYAHRLEFLEELPPPQPVVPDEVTVDAESEAVVTPEPKPKAAPKKRASKGSKGSKPERG